MPDDVINISTMYIDGIEIRRARKIKRISQASLGKMVGTDRNVIASIERGFLQAEPKLIGAIAEALEADTKGFYTDQPTAPQLTPLPIGKAIRKGRLAAGLRQKDLGNLIGCKDITISHIERAYRRPNRKLFAAINEALHLDPDQYRDLLPQTSGPDLSKSPTRIGQAIQRARWAIGMRQVDLARIVRASVNSISHIERGNRHPSRKLVDAIADALHVDLGDWPIAEESKSPAFPPPSYLGEAIQRARRSAGLSHQELADMVGCHKADVDRIEVGHRRQGPRELTTRIANVLKVDLGDWPDTEHPRLKLSTPERPAGAGQAIQRARQAAGLTQRKLAKLSGYSDSIISNIEHSHRSPPRSVLANIAKVLHVDISNLAEQPERAAAGSQGEAQPGGGVQGTPATGDSAEAPEDGDPQGPGHTESR
ncbi:MAG: transcriptional regulator [Phycisphaerae bacterium]|nr:transcriptional regulator [Phycisphaerae bacterium]